MPRFVLVLTFLAAAGPASAADRVRLGFAGKLGGDGLPSGWDFNRWSPMMGLGDFVAEAKVVTDGGRKVLSVRSVDAGFLVGTKRKVDVAKQPWASWRWKALKLPTGASFRQRSTNDQALQLLFGFDGGKVLGYIWDSSGKPGASGSGLSWREDVRVVVLQAGPSKVGRWVSERRNLRDDYAKLFGEAPPRLEGVAIQCNSQHTESEGHGLIGEIVLAAE